MRNFATLTRMRIQLTLRNKMFLFFSVVMPFAFFFLFAGIFAKGRPAGVRFFLGPVVALTVMGSFWGLSAALVMFREQGILRRFHVTPVTASDMLASSVVANYVLVAPTVLLEFLFARYLYHVVNFGDLFAAFIMISIGNLSFASLGLVVASVTNTMQETQVINQLLWLPLIFLSGATFPLAFLPQVVQKVSSVFASNLSRAGLAGRALQLDTHLESRRAGWRACLLGHPDFLSLHSAFPLGTGGEGATPREIACRRHGHSFSPSGNPGEQVRQYPGAGSVCLRIFDAPRRELLRTVRRAAIASAVELCINAPFHRGEGHTPIWCLL